MSLKNLLPGEHRPYRRLNNVANAGSHLPVIPFYSTSPRLSTHVITPPHPPQKLTAVVPWAVEGVGERGER